jgi:hypothetical protein
MLASSIFQNPKCNTIVKLRTANPARAVPTPISIEWSTKFPLTLVWLMMFRVMMRWMMRTIVLVMRKTFLRQSFYKNLILLNAALK